MVQRSFLLILLALTASSAFEKHYLFEYLTSTGCSFCPRGEHELDLLVNGEKNNVIYVSLHNISADPMYVEGIWNECATYAEANDFFLGTPSFLSDRKASILLLQRSSADDTKPLDSIVAQCPDIGEVPYGVALTHSYIPATKTISGKVTVEFEEIPDNNDIRALVYVVQDNIIYPQANAYTYIDLYPELYNAGNPLNDYTHHYVIRDEILNASFWGKPVSSAGPLQANTAYEMPFNYTLPSRFGSIDVVENDIHLVAAVIGYNGIVYNATRKHLLDDNVASRTMDEKYTDLFKVRVDNSMIVLNAPVANTIKCLGFTANGKRVLSTGWLNTAQGTVKIPLSTEIKASVLFLDIESLDGRHLKRKIVRGFQPPGR